MKQKEKLQPEIEEWKKKYGEDNVKKVTVEVAENDTAIMYFLDPKASPKRRSIYSRVLMMMRKDNTIDAGQIIMNECWLGGDNRFKDPDSMVCITGAITLTNEINFLPSSVGTA